MSPVILAAFTAVYSLCQLGKSVIRATDRRFWRLFSVAVPSGFLTLTLQVMTFNELVAMAPPNRGILFVAQLLTADVGVVRDAIIGTMAFVLMTAPYLLGVVAGLQEPAVGAI